MTIRSGAVLLYTAALVACMVVAGCDTSFEAFEETDQAYSVFGYLDANADTQYVRVEPIQDSTFVGSGALNARVTSTNVETGETVVWQDSTFLIGASEVPVHNFWTSADIAPQSKQRFQVEGARDGATSTAEVTVPKQFPPLDVMGGTPNLRDTSSGLRPPTQVRVNGVKHLGGVRADYDYLLCIPIRNEECRYVRRQVSVSALSDTTRLGENSWLVEIYWDRHIPDVVAQDIDVTNIEGIYSFRMTVAAVSEDWPAYAEGNIPGDATDQPLPPPGINSNIENGVGFLGGAFTRTATIPVRQKRSWDRLK